MARDKHPKSAEAKRNTGKSLSVLIGSAIPVFHSYGPSASLCHHIKQQHAHLMTNVPRDQVDLEDSVPIHPHASISSTSSASMAHRSVSSADAGHGPAMCIFSCLDE